MQDIQFLSTLSLRRATLLFWGEQYGGKISIHALLAESDGASNNPQHLPLAISIHALLAESDRHIFQVFAAAVIISIHALLAESDLVQIIMSGYAKISIHALLAESDNSSVNTADQEARFLSTLSLRRATHYDNYNLHCVEDFYPRSPCGERPCMILTLRCCVYFYPRSPCGERLEQSSSYSAYLEISIHALLAESDWPPVRDIIQWEDFYPRSPCGERRSTELTFPGFGIFLSTLSLRRATVKFKLDFINQEKFLSTLSLRRATFGRIMSVSSG